MDTNLGPFKVSQLSSAASFCVLIHDLAETVKMNVATKLL